MIQYVLIIFRSNVTPRKRERERERAFEKKRVREIFQGNMYYERFDK